MGTESGCDICSVIEFDFPRTKRDETRRNEAKLYTLDSIQAGLGL
jgi:hypothetical protein